MTSDPQLVRLQSVVAALRSQAMHWTRVGAALMATTLVAAPALAAPGDNEVGLNIHNGTGAFIAAAADLGVTWVRVDANWWSIEPTDDNYQWAALDTAVTAANANNLRVYMTLAYTPSWVARHGDTDGQSSNDVPNSAAEWTDFVRAAVTHYRALGVTHFGLWNEANLQGFWEGSLAEYATIIVNPGAAAVHAVCTDCVVLGPDLANVGAADDALEEILMRTPGAWDIITHHIYQDFAETGWRVWNGDGYINVLDDQRFPFTRRSLRQILDGAGWTGDVWITETGYRAVVGDAADEQLQAVYVRRALEEQLQRAWVNNTFFYEVHDCGPDQPTCTIDGFGLMRATAGTAGSRVFPVDFRLKPAFDELRQFIINNPAVVNATPAPQCGDGIDNDGDQRIDLDDRGCSGSMDDDESDDPPRRRLEASPQTITIDGDLRKFGAPGWIVIGDEAWRGTEPLGTDDLFVALAARYDATHLYIAVEVVDDFHINDQPANTLWQSDSVQIAFDIGQSGGTGYDAVDDHEWSFAASTDLSTAAAHREVGPNGATDDVVVASVRMGDRTWYEFAFDLTALPNTTFAEGEVVGFSILVNDDDGAGRVGWIEWTPGIGVAKQPEEFGEIVFVGEAPSEDAGVGDAGLTMDAMTTPDGSATADAAVPRDGGDAGAVRPTPRDAGPIVGAPSEPESTCACTAVRRRSGAPWALLGILILGFRRVSNW